MPQFLTGPGIAAALATALLANSAFAFQQTEGPPDKEPPKPRAAQENTHGGQFDSFGEGYIRMKVEGGKSHLHNITEETQVFIDGEPARLGNVRTGDRIEVTMGPNNVATKIEVLRNTARPEAAGQNREFRGRPDFEDQPQGEDQVQEQDQNTPWLGVILSEPEEGQQGVPIRQTFPSGPAARAGLRSGDVLLKIGGKDVASSDDAARFIEESKINEPVELVVARGDREVTLTATLANRSDFLFDFDRRMSNGQEGEGDFPSFEGFGIPDHAMALEQHRHLAAQHERIEQKLDAVLKELKALRKEVGVPEIEIPERTNAEPPEPDVKPDETQAPDDVIPEVPKP